MKCSSLLVLSVFAWGVCPPSWSFGEPPRDSELQVEGAILKTIESTSVAAQVAGMLQSLDIKEGALVKEGQELGRVRDTAVRIQSEKTKASLEIAKKKKTNDIDVRLAAKNKAVAENEYQRAVQANLLVKDTYPINEIDRLKLITDRASLELERAAFQQSMASLEVSVSDWEYKQSIELIDRHRVVAPSAGVVVSIEKRKGEWVEPGTVLFKIVQIDKLRVEGFLNALDVSPDMIGAKARLIFEDSSSSFETGAELVFISPDVNPLNSQVRVYLEVDNSNRRLRPGLRPKAILKRAP
ncbi:MAG: HlyD family efflux transporter periplasmic adaptor subunit [Pirellula sp.]